MQTFAEFPEFPEEPGYTLKRITPTGPDYVKDCSDEEARQNLLDFYDVIRKVAIAQYERGVRSWEETLALFRTPEQLDAEGWTRLD